MFAQYSPLFKAGLLSDGSPVPSRSFTPSFFTSRSKKTAHESLPVTVKSATFSWYAAQAPQDDSNSALYLTFEPSRRQHAQGRSFLSLDLADAMSLRMKEDTAWHATAEVGKKERVRSPTHSPAPSTSSTATIVPRAATPVLRRASGEIIHIPSPKPAPSIALPALPVSAVPRQPQPKPRRRRPSDITITFSSCFPDIDLSSPVSPVHRPTHSAPSILSSLGSPVRPDNATDSYLSFSTVESMPRAPVAAQRARSDSRVLPPASAPPTTAAFTSPSAPAPSVRSSVSSSMRQRNRSAALAALEGRSASGSPRRQRANSVKRPDNFMSMTDDEDDEDELDNTPFPTATKPGTVAQPVSPRPTRSKRSSVHLSPTSKRALHSSYAAVGNKRLSSNSETQRSRRRTVETFFAPLTNFIDLHTRDGEGDTQSARSSRSWRSFVEMAA